jgi:antitoxin VapB
LRASRLFEEQGLPTHMPSVAITEGNHRKSRLMTRSTVFTSREGQSIRLPKDVAFPEGVDQVEIVKVGHSRVVTPVGRRWDDLFLNGPRATSDFPSDREQPAAEEREPL